MTSSSSRERPEKILIAMYELSEGTTATLKYEDIVVAAFKRFPSEFALRGHPEYPDSSDIHKPLYGPLKRQGFVRAANKTFALTERGVEFAAKLAGRGSSGGGSPDRIDRTNKLELDRMFQSDALRFFLDGRPNKILDTDFYQFAGCTVRTPRNDFIARLKATSAVISLATKLKYPDVQTAKALAEVWKLLQEKFADMITRRRETKERGV